jgi:putative ABC transport system substrate-binding protein
MWNPDVAVNRSRQAAMTETARTLGLTTIPVEVRGVDTHKQAFATMTEERAQAFVVQEIACCTSIAARLQKWL